MGAGETEASRPASSLQPGQTGWRETTRVGENHHSRRGLLAVSALNPCPRLLTLASRLDGLPSVLLPSRRRCDHPQQVLLPAV